MRLHRIICSILAGSMVLALMGCNTSEQADGKTTETQYVIGEEPIAFVSDSEVKFVKQDKDYVKVYDKSELDEKDGVVITVDSANTKQTISGFGASFTDTATYLMMSLPEETRNDVMDKLFDEEKGIGLDLIRNPIGACDFSLEYYTYDDMPEGEEDRELKNFDFSKASNQVALTKQAMDINPDIKLFLAPWTAPLWMKTEYEWLGTANASLRRDCYSVYADYLVKCIQGYEEQDVPVYSISVQNEPMSSLDWPGMQWNWEQLANFTNDRLRPALDEAGLNTKIHNLDYNWNRIEEGGEQVMSSTIGSADGMAFHWYSGTPEQMAEFGESFPGIDMYVTEASYDRPSSLAQMLKITSYAARSLRSGANGYIMWNIAVGPNGGPTYRDINLHNSGLLTIDEEAETVEYTGDFYSMAHFSKFIHQGAVVVDSTDTGIDNEYKLVNVVTRNPNGTMTAVVVNSDTDNTETCKFVMGDKVMEVNVSPRSTVTITWNAN